ncbi:HAD-superfamily hydrolase [Basidiobolus meristosporus CBS 931.73]|uniref:HAD-superfamily hydrolase n=1 Tax=Basidiobolus meristosporus CBS 931.73 TaxID=1314790 RepID=A0A1Y1YP36_9FUNG|nr:HAD-superfamily hydrolase [Basidiobolus meristosporus CBS 931.73]|eukprot:ORX99344.1 HAD-superfamily hydrolase [Basidiobolus meristosporus CBS 931.73]
MAHPLLRLITFDAYGTLFTPKGTVAAQYARALGKCGVHIEEQQIAHSFKQAFMKQAESFPNYGKLHGLESREWWKSVVNNTFLGAGVSKEALHPVFEDTFKLIYDGFNSSEGYELYSDTKSLLKELRKTKVQLAVITNCDQRVTEVMDSLGILEDFEFVITSSGYGEEKPAPGIFHHAVDVAKVKPTETLHVGDDYAKDFEAAKRAGLHALYLERDPVKYAKALANNTEAIQSLTEILDWKMPV